MPIPMTEEQYHHNVRDFVGICRKCHAEAFECEGDACNRECESCGEEEVFGTEELLMMGEIEITED